MGSGRTPRTDSIEAATQETSLLSLLFPYRIELPALREEPDVMSVSMAGIGVSSETVELTDHSRPEPIAINTDVMSIESVPVVADRGDNVPQIDGEEQTPDAYVDELRTGFEATYEALLRLREEGRLEDVLNLGDTFTGIENRLVYRPSMRYAKLIHRFCSRESLRDGIKWGITMEELAVPLCDGTVSEPVPWDIFAAERRDMVGLDIPRITCRPDETTLRSHGRCIGVEAECSGLERARERLDTMDRSDLERQLEIIEHCFASDPNSGSVSTAPTTTNEMAMTPDRRQTAAATVFDELWDAGTESTPDRSWIAAKLHPDSDRLTLRPVDQTLHLGRGGIALLAAALYRTTGEERYREHAKAIIRPVRELVRSERPQPGLLNHGGIEGVGSVIYALTAVGSVLDDSSLFDDATSITSVLTPSDLNDSVHDVGAGTAGTILGLLSLYDRSPDQSLLTCAESLGDSLLESRVTTANGFTAWQTLDKCPPLTGFAHGNSGIAYSLARLYDVSGQTVYRDAALEALEFEAEFYSEHHKGWPDRRPWTEQHCTGAWSHGRAGGGLARLGIAEHVQDELVEQGIDRAIEGVNPEQLSAADHVTGGTAGRVAFLTEVERRRGRCDDVADQLASEMIRRRNTSGRYRTNSPVQRLPTPTFAEGDTGIAYTILRSTAPEELPCVLLWE